MFVTGERKANRPYSSKLESDGVVHGEIAGVIVKAARGGRDEVITE